MTSRQDRYRLHDLLRLYAHSRHRSEDGTERSATARTRLRNWLLDTAVLAGRWYEPDYGAPPPDPGRLVALDDREQAARWIKAESDAWLAAFREAAAGGEHARVAEVAEAMHWFSDHWASSGHWVEVYERAAEAGAALGDAGLEATHRNYLAWAYWACEARHDEAVEAATRALGLAEAAGSIAQQAWAHNYLSWLRAAVGDFSRAADSNQRAMELFAEADDVNGHLQASGRMITLLYDAGRVEEAVESYRKNVAALDDPDLRDRIPPNIREFAFLTATYSVSFVHLQQGLWREAADALLNIRGQFDTRGWYLQAGKVHLHLAHALARLGEHAEAAVEYRAVLALEDRVPAGLRDDALAGLAALTEGRPAPALRFVR